MDAAVDRIDDETHLVCVEAIQVVGRGLWSLLSSHETQLATWCSVPKLWNSWDASLSWNVVVWQKLEEANRHFDQVSYTFIPYKMLPRPEKVILQLDLTNTRARVWMKRYPGCKRLIWQPPGRGFVTVICECRSVLIGSLKKFSHDAVSYAVSDQTRSKSSEIVRCCDPHWGCESIFKENEPRLWSTLGLGKHF